MLKITPLTLGTQAKDQTKEEAQALAHSALQRGDVCVFRRIQGRLFALRLHNPRSYAEWLGCFSII